MVNQLEQVTNILADKDYNDGANMAWHPSGTPTEQAEKVAQRIVSEVVQPLIAALTQIREGVDEWEASGDDNVLVNDVIDPILIRILGKQD